MEVVLFLIMKKSFVYLFLIVTCCFTQQTFSHTHKVETSWPPVSLPPIKELPSLQPTSIVVTTNNSEAQLFFNYGLSALHAYAYLEAYRSFDRALRLDPKMTLGHWGKAYSFLGVGKTGPQLDKLISQALSGVEEISEIEKMYVWALAAYTRSDKAYIEALEKLLEKFPDELEAKLLLGFFMNDQYDHLGNPKGHQAYANTLLRPLLKQYPDHVGVHHAWIHAVESGQHPERAAYSTEVLRASNSSFGHIAHMPGHMAWSRQDYKEAVKYFRQAERVDLEYLKETGLSVNDYWSYLHNMSYLLVAEIESGDFVAARQSIERVTIKFNQVGTSSADSVWQKFQSDHVSRLFSRSGDWLSTNNLLENLEVDTIGHKIKQLHSSILSVLNIELKQTQKKHKDKAKSELVELSQQVETFGQNETFYQMLLFEARAVVSALNGDGKSSVASFRQALVSEQKIPYEEPPLRVRTVYETAGQTFCHFQLYDVAVSMYKEAIKLTKNNGHAIQGMISCLRAQGDSSKANQLEKKLNTIW